MTDKIDIHTLNNATQAEFIETLAEIYEHSSWIPEKVWHSRPFLSVDNLHQAMLKIVENASIEEKLTLLRAHPQLAGKEAKSGSLTTASTQEQSSANLNALSKKEMDEITSLNQQYIDTHGFPFIIAVKNHDKAGIFNEFRKRINKPYSEEVYSAILQVGLIATFRLAGILKGYEPSA
ncbi:urate oxidase [Glaciecola punicea ACAM 611]|jgi:2-oxo-4-hydroxy-4-carboxy-5-ureidoimidazoline decarboxylase|uniref:2-oxo-4-hydroxy-4-carboxy-5-ureidoimidazoline decarboxylase n=1 Tax=Glaciecola punicea ACAM 611 TaxID=1121923 RepID=H5T884_9ALTE|nr:2-oxo-4-hydroxy-4-carboxy-5-ureidoimidazoline decarboxylase [Glaciecola punicea]OFA29919.1 OHCU decarboxylase [Glaciecola punicea]GAB54525.1 urate oxidase [Glaciecola punicea ACAM 611]